MFKLNKKHNCRQSGFTLIELMIVIGIIGILAAILTPTMMRARFKAYHVACVANERNLSIALEIYSLEFGQLYPSDILTLTQGPSPYIAIIEECPSAGISYTTSYTVYPDLKGYVIECPGRHEIQLAGVVEDNYPRTENGRLNQNGP